MATQKNFSLHRFDIYFQSHIPSFARCVLRIAREREIRKGKG
jgi:hypothetical protein